MFVSVCVCEMRQSSFYTSESVIPSDSWHKLWIGSYMSQPRRVKAADVKSSCADSERWLRNRASVSAPFVSPLAPLCGTADLTTWLADKQLIE